MEASTPAWLNTLTIIGAVLVLAGGGFIGYRISNMRQTYRDLQPDRRRDNDASGNAVFMIVSVLVLMIGVLLLGLGIAGIAGPEQLS